MTKAVVKKRAVANAPAKALAVKRPAAKKATSSARAAPGIRVGVGGWTYEPWRGLFYPDDLVQKRELEYASRQFTAVEVNGTFYGAQKPATFAKWRDETPDGYMFSLKAPRYVVQARELAKTAAGIERFVQGGMAELGAKLGPLLWQFAPTKTFDRDDLAAFLDLLPRTLNGRPLRHVLEVRNQSFLCEDYLALTRQHNVPTVFTDSAEYPSFADPSGDFCYARLMRAQADVVSGYPGKELDAWAKRAHIWAEGGVPADLPRVVKDVANDVGAKRPTDVFVFFISAAKERNPAAARGLIERL